MRWIAFPVGALLAGLSAWAGNGPASAPAPKTLAAETDTFKTDVPAHPFDLILVRPENTSIALSVLAYREIEGYVVYGTSTGEYRAQTPLHQYKPDEPTETVLSGLHPGTRYYYQFRSRTLSAGPFESTPEYTFRTAPLPGNSFTFTLSADAHLDEKTSPQVYQQTLNNIRQDQPEFHLDLGNLFMTDKHAARKQAAKQYLAQRYYLGQIGASAPLMLVLGTHDGESSKNKDSSPDCLYAWSNAIRRRYFPNPAPDDFFTGNTDRGRGGEFPQDYFAWPWGDALFVVLDPFGYSTHTHGNAGGWDWSLGKVQYQWLQKTLEQSHARFKFVFIHNLLEGDPSARGGVEVATLNEWGGKNSDGTDGFTDHRPGWDMPIHQLLLRNHVAAVFKAHDNFYARQELDGIVYLMVPQPSFAGTDRIRDLDAYGYKHGIFIGNSGHVRVMVTPGEVTIEYVRARLPADENMQHKNREVADSFTIKGNDAARN